MQLHVGRQLLDHAPLQKKLRTDAIEKAEKWDLAPKFARLWWTSTNEEEESSEVLFAMD